MRRSSNAATHLVPEVTLPRFGENGDPLGRVQPDSSSGELGWVVPLWGTYQDPGTDSGMQWLVFRVRSSKHEALSPQE